jgi:hypothetical protein
MAKCEATISTASDIARPFVTDGSESRPGVWLGVLLWEQISESDASLFRLSYRLFKAPAEGQGDPASGDGARLLAIVSHEH